MSADNPTKINKLLAFLPPGVVMQSSWLSKQGYSLNLQKRYRKSKWLRSIGTGAMIRNADQVSYEGAIYALQKQSGLNIHPGGRTALSLLGKMHYLELSAKKVILFGGKEEALPLWFEKHDWGVKIEMHHSSFLPPETALSEVELKNFSIKVSSAERAMMECLYLAPKKQELTECLEILQGLNNLRPNYVQTLLEQCQSVKVKRLFLFMAEKINHDWFQYLDPAKIDLGRGKRSIVNNGLYVAKYQITVPKELEEYDKQSI